MTNLTQWTDGQMVKGEYHGVNFTGRILDSTAHAYFNSRRAPKGDTFIFAIALESEIMVYGYSRTHLEIWSNDPFSTLEVA